MYITPVLSCIKMCLFRNVGNYLRTIYLSTHEYIKKYENSFLLAKKKLSVNYCFCTRI